MKISGETVTVALRVLGAEDELGNASISYADPIEVENVLIGKGRQYSRVRDGQIYAYQSDISFCFPRDWSSDLTGALITRSGRTYEVIGNPSPITDANIPSGIDWNIQAQAVAYHG